MVQNFNQRRVLGDKSFTGCPTKISNPRATLRRACYEGWTCEVLYKIKAVIEGGISLEVVHCLYDVVCIAGGKQMKMERLSVEPHRSIWWRCNTHILV